MTQFEWRRYRVGLLLGLSLLLCACAPPPPRNQLNVCSIFSQYPEWFWATQAARKRWGVPISVQMAIIHQESHFRADAMPPRTQLLGIIPWTRPTTAEGYTQAVDSTWQHYLRATGQTHASRSDFAYAADFVGWFAYRSHRRLGISRNNAFALYIAYHEGDLGFSQRTYRHKRWLMRVAHSVQRVATRYRWQLRRCEPHLAKKPWWR